MSPALARVHVLSADYFNSVRVFVERRRDRKPLIRRADAAWKEAKLDRITLHECRHTFASLMIAAGVNAKALQAFMGHASINVTMDRYGHLMPGSEAEAAELLDATSLRNGSGTRTPRGRL